MKFGVVLEDAAYFSIPENKKVQSFGGAFSCLVAKVVCLFAIHLMYLFLELLKPELVNFEKFSGVPWGQLLQSIPCSMLEDCLWGSSEIVIFIHTSLTLSENLSPTVFPPSQSRLKSVNAFSLPTLEYLFPWPWVTI